MYQGDSVNKEFQTSIEDLFYKYGVDIYFSGHVHSYERDYPVYKGVLDPNGYVNPSATTYLMIGGAGNDEMTNDLKESPNSWSPPVGVGKWIQSSTTGAWTAATDAGYTGVGKLTVVDDSTLTFSYFRSKTGELHDFVTLKRDHSIYIEKFAATNRETEKE